MNTTPHDLDELASEYVLGTLAAEQRAAVERRLGQDADLRAAVDAWEQRLLPLTDLADPVRPGADLWPRIEHSLGHARRPLARPPTVSWWNRLAVWRGLAGSSLVASLVLATLLLTRTAAINPMTYVVVLVAPQNQAPGWVIQASNTREIRLIPLGVMEVPTDKTLQFWTKGEDWQAPVSLGLVKPGQTLSIPLDRLPPLAPNQLFELTLENAGGSTTGKPTGPIQAIGRAVKVI
ncbi:RNA polymerase subunit sigma-70 [Pseudomonas sp. CCM 7891]|uniref:RNA polymerase subunit sigma-70 n=1 Tax=Pseudomonas karstica TaxID=1055468 RepID=A0A7X2RWF3_9PSED|nr:anti-sigma factor [Pseudomonas karstica]MTD22276.1 RNA polymerase subunit sigma-70 [Pseudomonas karstica]